MNECEGISGFRILHGRGRGFKLFHLFAPACDVYDHSSDRVGAYMQCACIGKSPFESRVKCALSAVGSWSACKLHLTKWDNDGDDNEPSVNRHHRLPPSSFIMRRILIILRWSKLVKLNIWTLLYIYKARTSPEQSPSLPQHVHHPY